MFSPLTLLESFAFLQMSLTEHFPQPPTASGDSQGNEPLIDKPPFPNAEGIDTNPERDTTRIETPFYRTISEPYSPGSPEYYANFRPYSLFCLRTIVTSFAGHYPQFQSFCQDNKMQMYLVFGSRLPAETERYIARIVRNVTGHGEPRCVLLDSSISLVTAQQERIPNSWIQRMLPFVDLGDISASLLLGIFDEPVDDKTRLYVDLSQFPNYTEEYSKLLLSTQQQLEDMWNQGTVRFARSIATKWSLQHLGDDLFQATWRDKRFAPSPTLFLLSRLRGERTIFVDVGSNLVRKHQVAARLSQNGFQFWFVNNTVEIVVDDLYQARRASTIAFNEKRRAEGKVVVNVLKYPTSLSGLYRESQRKEGNAKTESSEYLQATSKGLHTVISTKIPLWMPEDEVQRRIQQDVRSALSAIK